VSTLAQLERLLSNVRTSPVVSIVEDDAAVRTALGNLVRSMGYRVMMFESAEAYLASGHFAQTSCMISDVLMPGMSGDQMHERLVAQGNACPTIFVSAFPTDALQAKLTCQGALVLLEKPCAPSAIAHWIGVALADR
jgi:FixJ family two-component response regulator